MASTLRAHGPPPAIRALVDSGSHMCDPYGARALVSASHHANAERLEPKREEPKRDTHKIKNRNGTPIISRKIRKIIDAANRDRCPLLALQNMR